MFPTDDVSSSGFALHTKLVAAFAAVPKLSWSLQQPALDATVAYSSSCEVS